MVEEPEIEEGDAEALARELAEQIARVRSQVEIAKAKLAMPSSDKDEAGE